MKYTNININYEGLNAEDKVKLKICYLYSLPDCKEKEVMLNTLNWVLDILDEEKEKSKRKIR